MKMAGKLHRDYAKYSTGGGGTVAPTSKLKIAYAEGYNASRAGALRTANPHPLWQGPDVNSDYWAWDQGWLDKNTSQPPTHVG